MVADVPLEARHALSLQPTRCVQEARGLPGLRAALAGSPLGPKGFDLWGLARVQKAKSRFESVRKTDRYRSLCRSPTQPQFAGTATVGFKICRWWTSLQTVGLGLPGCPARLERPARNDQRFLSGFASRRSDSAHAYPPDAAPSGVRDHGHLRRNRQALDEVLHLIPWLSRCFNRRFPSRLGPRPRAHGHQSKQTARSVVLLPEFSKRIIGWSGRLRDLHGRRQSWARARRERAGPKPLWRVPFA